MKKPFKVGIAQYASYHLDLNRSLSLLKSIVEEAASKEIKLLVFGETWLSGYPVWIDHCPEVAYWDNESFKEAYLQLRDSSIEIPGKETDQIKALAQKHGMVIVLGVNEVIKKGKGSGTVYNSLLTFNTNGELSNHHRKLVPTFTEKMIYGHGDGSGLRISETPYGKVGGLVCWEHWMPLTRQAMHDEAEDIHVAVWPIVHERHQIACRQYAFEGRCYVLAAGQLLKASAFPKELQLPENLAKNPEQLVMTGGSCIIDPRGEFIVEPLFNEEQLIIAEIDLDMRKKEQLTLDVSGHYQRPDVFKFKINRKRPV